MRMTISAHSAAALDIRAGPSSSRCKARYTVFAMLPELFELVLCVRDVEKSARFYREVVSLEPIREPGDGWASFWAGRKEDNRWLGLREGTLLYEEHSPRAEGQRFGPVHFALKLPDSARASTLDR